ncbi:FBD-associated F-box protein At5g56370-like isoform X1 [Arachis ipaensis]|uniref:FBD-associated F-box protein At5g56370-like isoform X1 n=1 Tax=Arachis ipaensis TaxID=130454 RepID=UPI000A2B3877|nr:FBD-associated F-box protein At5g56370-like isoform X1 [Arachis ipaensis]XP_025680038.1 FBD-associated F-box protein At5g56370 [Arachis hypogaea]
MGRVMTCMNLSIALRSCRSFWTEQYSHSENVTLELLEVNTSSLEYLRLKLRGCYKQILVCDYPNINKACLDIYHKPRHVAWVPKLLRALCKTKFLWLQVSTIQCLIRAPVLDLPDFCNLIQLQLDFYSFKSRLLIDLLHNCPKLQALKINISEFVLDYWYGSYSYLNSHKRNDWTQPLSVPNCIVSDLSTVEYRGYRNTPEEHEFTAYILQKGLVLKTMRIHAKYCDLPLKGEVFKALSKIQRGSSMCRVEVD